MMLHIRPKNFIPTNLYNLIYSYNNNIFLHWTEVEWIRTIVMTAQVSHNTIIFVEKKVDSFVPPGDTGIPSAQKRPKTLPCLNNRC